MLRISLFGRPVICHDDAPVTAAARPKVVPLLAYLLLHETSERRHAAADLWPEHTDAEARANLRRHLTYLKDWLPPEVTWFFADGAHLRWNQGAPYSLDVRDFERLAASQETFEEAVALYRGDLCEGFDEEWLAELRRSLAQRYVAAVSALSLSWRARRDLERAVHWSRRLLEYDPWREDAIRQIMLARYEAGDRTGAMREYERFRGNLREELQVEPMAETAAVYEAIRRDIPPAGMLGAAYAKESVPADFRLVGRERELGRLSQSLANAASGQTTTAYIVGEAGIGKTRLLREFGLQCESAGALVLWASVSSPELMPYQPFVTLVRSALPLLETVELDDVWRSTLDLVTADDQPEKPAPRAREFGREQARLFEAISMALIALSGRRPLCIVLEDLHAAGTGTLELTRYLRRRAAGAKMLIAISYRDDEPYLAPALRTLRREGSDEARADIPLRRLSVDEIEALLKSNPKRADLSAQELVQKTAGNPLFVTEVLRAGSPLTDPHPSFARTVLGRIEALPEEGRALADIGAICSGDFSLELVREVTNWPEAAVADTLSELIDRHILTQSRRERKTIYTFAHQLIGAALYDAIAPSERRVQHRRVAQVMERIYLQPDAALVGRLAFHWDGATEGSRAAPYYLDAGRRAVAIFALAEAVAPLERALALAHEVSQRFEVLLLLEQIASFRGDRAEQRGRLDQAHALLGELGAIERCNWLRRRIDLANSLSDHEDESRWISALRTFAAQEKLVDWEASALEADAKRLRTLNRFDEEEECFRKLVSLLEIDSHRFASAYAAHADTLIYQGKLDEARAYLQPILAGLNQQVERRDLARLLMSFSRAALVQQDYAAMSDYAWQAHAVSLAIGDREGEALALHNIANGLVYTFDVTQTRRLYARVRELYRALGHAVGLAGSAVDEGLFATELGLFQQARDLYDEALRLASEIDSPWIRCVASINASYSERLEGNYTVALGHAKRALKAAKQLKAPQLESAALGTLGTAQFFLGDLQAARTTLQAAVELRRGAPSPRLGDNLCALAQTLLATGERDPALRIARELVEMHASNPKLAPQPVEWLLAAAQVFEGADGGERAVRLREDALALYNDRLSRIPDEPTRAAYAALPFNRVLEALMVSLRK